MLIRESRHNLWYVLPVILQGCLVLGLGRWVLLLSTICSSPPAPDAATRHVISYNCHGTVVFISRIQYVLLLGLIPALLVAGLCGKVAKKRAEPLSGEPRG
jgi:hypothetical protein